MRNPIYKADWEKVREALMEAQIPFRVTFDSHLNEVTDNANIYYDIQIQVEPFYFQEKRKVLGNE
jgi:hypothetical protein